jgi:hypothetical protein
LKNLLEVFTISRIENEVPPELFKKAYRLVQTEAVFIEKYNSRHIEGTVEEDGEEYYPEITSTKDGFEILCSCIEQENDLCVHLVALLIEWVIKYGQNPPPSNRQYQNNFSLILPPCISGELLEEEISEDLRVYLSQLNVKDLRALAGQRDIKVSGLKKEVILDQLAAGLLDPTNLEKAVQKLPFDSRLVLSYLSVLAESLHFNISARLIGPNLDAALALHKTTQPVRPAAHCLEDLRKVGLLFGSDQFMKIPLQATAYHDIQPSLFKQVKEPGSKIQLADGFATVRLAWYLLGLAYSEKLQRAPETLRDQFGWPASAGYQSPGKPPPVQAENFYLAKDLLNEIGLIAGKEKIQIDLLAQVLAAGRLWEYDKPENLTTNFSAWLEMSPSDQSKQLMRQMITLTTTIELTAAREAGRFVVQRPKISYLQWSQFIAALAQVRIRLLDLVARAPGGEWLDIDHLLRTIHALLPDWITDTRRAKPVSGSDNSFIYVNNKPVDASHYEQWVKTYGKLHLIMLTNTLNWFGLVDIAYLNGQPQAFRINDFGEYLLDRRKDFPKSSVRSSGGLRILPDGRLSLNPLRADPDLSRLVMKIAVPDIDTPGKTKKKLNELPFNITLQGVQNEFRTGTSPAAIIEALEKGIGKSLPEGLSRAIQQLWDRFGKLYLYPEMTLIEFADDFCLPELLAGTSLDQILLHTFSPRLIAIQNKGLSAWMEELIAKGYTPRLEQVHHEN